MPNERANKKIFIWTDVERVSDRWHEDGGLAIIADDEEAARAMIDAHEIIIVEEFEWREVEVFPIVAHEDRIWVFPDAGCC